MPQIVEIPDKNIEIEFPDDMSPKDIETAIRVHVYGQDVLTSAPEPEEQSYFEKVKSLFVSPSKQKSPEDIARAQIELEAAREGKTVGEYKTEIYPEGSRLRRAHELLSDVQSGALGVAESLFNAADWITSSDTFSQALGTGALALPAQVASKSKGVQKSFADVAEGIRGIREKLAPEGKPTYADELMQGVGSMAAFFIPGLGIARSASEIGMVAPRLANWLGTGVSTALEAMSEAGQAYHEVKQKTGSEEQANEAARLVLGLNMALISITDKLGLFGEAGRRLRRAATTAFLESGQEGLQNVIQDFSQGRNIDWRGALRTFLVTLPIGAVAGGLTTEALPGEETTAQQLPPLPERTEEGIRAQPQEQGPGTQTEQQQQEVEPPKTEQPKPETPAEQQKVDLEALKAELNPKQVEIIDKRVKELGSIDKVKELYKEDTPSGKYALALAEELYKPPEIKPKASTGGEQPKEQPIVPLENPAPVEIQARQQQTKPKTFRQWIKEKGGINPHDKTLKGELNDLRWDINAAGKKVQKGFPVGFWNTKARFATDELVEEAIREGWLPPWSDETDLIEAIQDNIKHPESEISDEKFLEDYARWSKEVLPGKKLQRVKLAQVPAEQQITSLPKRHGIIRRIETALSIPIRTGKFRERAEGIYKPRSQVIRLKKANDFEVAIHEVGHHIQRLMGIDNNELASVEHMAYEGAKDKRKEGFAEFVRYYVTNPKIAKEKTPEFYQKFENTLADHPDVQDVIVKARQAWQQWQAAPPVQKVLSFIEKGKDLKKRRFPTLNEIYTNFVDELHPLKLLRDAAEKKRGRPFNIKEDPFRLAWLTRGWIGKAEAYLKHERFQLDDKAEHGVKFTGKSLKDILAPVEKNGERELLDAYLLSKRAIHDERILEGFKGILDKETFEQAVKELEPRFEKVAKELYQYNSDLLDYLVDSGRISKETADVIKKRNLFYAPLYRVMDDLDTSVKGLSRKRFGNVASPVKTLRGSSRSVISPTENIMYNTYAMINAAERNRVGVALAKLSEIPGMGEFIERIPFPVKPNKVDTIEGLKQLADSLKDAKSTTLQGFGEVINDILGHQKEVRSLLRKLGNKEWIDKHGREGAERELEKAGLTWDDLEKLKDTLVTFRPNYRPKKNELIFYIDGKPALFEVSPELYQAIQGLDSTHFGALLKVLSLPAKALRAGATLTPEFMGRNIIRDAFTRFLYSKYGIATPIETIRGLFHAIKKDKLYNEFLASGAAHGALVSLDREYLSKNLEEILKSKGRKVTHLIKHPLQALQVLSELSEEATRLAEFQRALKKSKGKGLSKLYEAGLASRDITLDFSRIGAKTKAMNAITAFWNAQLQGVDKMVRAFKEKPVETSARMFLSITLPKMLLWWAQKDDPAFQELPTWRRILFFNFVTHNPDGTTKHIWSIPIPFEPGLLFGSFPEMIADWMYTKDPEGVHEAFRSLFESLSPGVIPTAAAPIIEWFANRSLFFDRPIVPRSREGLEPELQYSQHTTEAVKLLAKAMAKVPELKEFASPAKIENLIYGYTAGTGRYFLKSIDSLLEKSKLIKTPPKPSMTLADIPGIKGFVARFPSVNSRSIEKFYDRYTKLSRKWESMKERAKVRGLGLKINPPPELERYRQAAKALSIYRKIVSLTYDNEKLTPEQKREIMDNATFAMINIARRALGKKPINFKTKTKKKKQ